jgi:hypothetical protein
VIGTALQAQSNDRAAGEFYPACAKHTAPSLRSKEVEDTAPGLKNKLYGLAFVKHLFDSCQCASKVSPNPPANPHLPCGLYL